MNPTSKKVLVVDDDRNIVELLMMVLQDDGYQVVTAGDGNQAVHSALQHHPDAIILDVMMPVMDGWETCEHLLSHEQTAGIPVIFLTARTGNRDQLRGWYRGCFDYITKPFEVEQLLKCVSKATSARDASSHHAWESLRGERIAVLEGTDDGDHGQV